MVEQDKPLQVVSQQNLDFRQLAPVVEAFQMGEVEKLKILNSTEIEKAKILAARQKDIDNHVAGKMRRQDIFEVISTILLFFVCGGMAFYGAWYRDTGFITAGLTSFSTYLAGLRASRGQKPKE